MIRQALFAALTAALLASPGALADDYDAGGDGNEWDIYVHVSQDELREKLRREGYSDIELAERNRRDRMIDMEATNASGERMRIRFDTLGNLIWTRPAE